MDLNAILMRGMHFILDTYICFRYPCIKITQTNIYYQLARIPFLCIIFLVFYLLDNPFAWYQDLSACLAINGRHVRSLNSSRPKKLWEVTKTTPKPWCTLWSAFQFLELTHQARVPLQTTFLSTHESFLQIVHLLTQLHLLISLFYQNTFQINIMFFWLKAFCMKLRNAFTARVGHRQENSVQLPCHPVYHHHFHYTPF